MSWFTTQMVREGAEQKREMTQLNKYVNLLNNAEDKLIKKEAEINMMLRHLSILPSIDEINARLSPEAKIIGFVADHLEFGCQEGMHVVKISIPPIETHLSQRLDAAY